MGRVLAIVLPGLAFALAAVLLVPALLGYDRYVVTSGSMAGSYDRGDLVLSKPVPVADLRRGDVVTYTPPGGRELVTHRIVAVERSRDGVALRTRGDANPANDPYAVAADAGELPRAQARVPQLGWVLAALDVRWVRLLVITLPALLIATALLRGAWREGPRSFDITREVQA